MQFVMRFIPKVIVPLFGQLTINILQLLAKSQLSANPLIRSCGYPFFKLANILLGRNGQRLIAHVSQRKLLHKRRTHIKNPILSSLFTLGVANSLDLSAFHVKPSEFRSLLIIENLDADHQYELAHQLFQAGCLVLACEVFEDLVVRSSNKLLLDRRLQLLRDTGIAHFLLGKIEQANVYWANAGRLRRFILGDNTGPIYRILGNSWFMAIGHVAMLDFYMKYNQLYRAGQVRIVAQQDLSNVPGNYLCERLAQTGIVFIEQDQLNCDYNKWAKKHGKRSWSQLTKAEGSAHIDDFWEFEFPDGEVWGYTHAADKIQKEWEQQQRPPLLTVTEGEKLFLDSALRMLGLPDNAWYVCLHVREPGFHKNWNSLYPSMRDANIDDYLPAIKLIVESGGWVIRMGDPSMKPLPSMEGMIDYAHSNLKTPKADILITLGCRFLLGTNSGFATIPAIYGVRCIFSNWLPIGLPLWPSQDLMCPKMFWDIKLERYLTLEEVFSSKLAFIQNYSDLPEGIALHDNTPEEILALTEEALGMAPEVSDEKLSEVRTRYRQIAKQHNGYVGSTLAASFIKSHY